MPNYKESQIAAFKWQRCKSISIANEYNQIPSVTFYEEEIVVIENSLPVKNATGACTAQFNPQQIINIIDPVTGESTGQQYTHAQLYEILYSLYIDTATKRDALAIEEQAARAQLLAARLI